MDEHGAEGSLSQDISLLPRTPQLDDIQIENGRDFASFEEIHFKLVEAVDNPFPVELTVWDFGDGSVVEEDGIRVVYNYRQPGDYHITVTAYEEHGSSASLEMDITIANLGPVVEDMELPEEVLFAGYEFQLGFTASDEDGSLEELRVDISSVDTGDPVDSLVLDIKATKALITIAEPGDFLFTVVATDNNGTSGQDSAVLTVLDPGPTAVLSFVSQEDGSQGSVKYLRCQFSAYASDFDHGEITAYRFDFGDGEQSDWQTDYSAVHDYFQEGNFTVTVTVRNDLGEEDSATLRVEVVFSGTGEETVEPDGDAGFLPGFGVVGMLIGLALVVVKKRKF